MENYGRFVKYNNNKVNLKNFQNGLQVLAGVNFQNH